MYPFKCALAPDVPNNEGLFRPIHVSAPEGSILNATFPVPVKARAKTTNNLNQVIFGAVWPLFGERVQASGGGIWPMVLMGDDPERGHFLVDMLPHGGRGGDADARRDGAGLVSREQHDHAVRDPRAAGARPVPEEGALGRTAAAPAATAAVSAR